MARGLSRARNEILALVDKTKFSAGRSKEL